MRFEKGIDVESGKADYREALRQDRIARNEISETEGAIERNREQAAEQLAKQIDEYFKNLRGVEHLLNRGEGGRETSHRFAINAESVAFSVEGERRTVEMAEPLVMDVDVRQDEDGTHRTMLIRAVTMELPPAEAAKYLPAHAGLPEQNWIVKQNDLCVNTYRYGGETVELEFSKGWNEFVQQDMEGAHFTNHDGVPHVTIESLTNLIKEANEQLLVLHQKARLAAV